MTPAEWAVSTLGTLGAIGGGGQVWIWLTSRGRHRLEHEANAIRALDDRIKDMEKEIKSLRHDAHVYRRVSHDTADVANSCRLLLVAKFIEVNEVLMANGKPERYPDPVKAAMEAVAQISERIVGERQALYDRAERMEGMAELNEVAVATQKETIVKASQ